MIAGKIQLSGFNYGVAEGKNPNGTALKVLGFQPQGQPFEIQLVFTEDEFKAFIAKCNDTGIVAATEIPKIIKMP